MWLSGGGIRVPSRAWHRYGTAAHRTKGGRAGGRKRARGRGRRSRRSSVGVLDATACDGAGVLPQKRRITVTYSLPVGNIKQLQGCPACACLAAPLSSLREQSEPPISAAATTALSFAPSIWDPSSSLSSRRYRRGRQVIHGRAQIRAPRHALSSQTYWARPSDPGSAAVAVERQRHGKL